MATQNSLGNIILFPFRHRLAQVNGPLSMYPAADDNYGLDACSLLCLHSQPPIVAMGTGSGKIYHCIVLESEETFDPEEVSFDIADYWSLSYWAFILVFTPKQHQIGCGDRVTLLLFREDGLWCKIRK